MARLRIAGAGNDCVQRLPSFRLFLPVSASAPVAKKSILLAVQAHGRTRVGHAQGRGYQSEDVGRLLAKAAKGRPRPRKHPLKQNPRSSNMKAAFRPTPVRANRVGEIVRKLVNLAIRWQMRADNPASGFSRFPEVPRDRFLSIDEITRLAEVLAGHANRRCANAIRLILLTEARRGEALNARWDQFDLENGACTKPAATTRQPASRNANLLGRRACQREARRRPHTRFAHICVPACLRRHDAANGRAPARSHPSSDDPTICPSV